MRAHGQSHHDRQTRAAKLMIASGLVRVAVWGTMLALYAIGPTTVRHLYAEVQFVTILSVLALLLTDWGQVAASLAQLAAARAHHDAETAALHAGAEDQP